MAWALGITAIDPIPYCLLFERFLNLERVSMPDFDIDFCMARRDEVIDYVSEKYGRASVGQIATFQNLKARSVLKDVGRAMGIAVGGVLHALNRLQRARRVIRLVQVEIVIAHRRPETVTIILFRDLRQEGKSSVHIVGVDEHFGLFLHRMRAH